jgi:hypothetical protein
MRKIIGLLITIVVLNFGYSQTDNLDVKSIMFEDYDKVENFKSTINSKTYTSYNSTSNQMLGPGMMLGGAGFLLAGILTGTNRVQGTSQSPYYDINKYMAIGTGSLLLTSGLVVTIATR